MSACQRSLGYPAANRRHDERGRFLACAVTQLRRADVGTPLALPRCRPTDRLPREEPVTRQIGKQGDQGDRILNREMMGFSALKT
jgi:hypothetical protein